MTLHEGMERRFLRQPRSEAPAETGAGAGKGILMRVGAFTAGPSLSASTAIACAGRRASGETFGKAA